MDANCFEVNWQYADEDEDWVDDDDYPDDYQENVYKSFREFVKKEFSEELKQIDA